MDLLGSIYNTFLSNKRTNKMEENMTSFNALLYCRDVEDRKSIRKFITRSFNALLYCRYVKDRKSIRKLITDSDDAFWYCKFIKDRKSMREFIADDALIDQLDNIKLSKKDK